MPKLVRWKLKNNPAGVRQFGAIEAVEDHLAEIWISQGKCEEVSDDEVKKEADEKAKAAAVAAAKEAEQEQEKKILDPPDDPKDEPRADTSYSNRSMKGRTNRR